MSGAPDKVPAGPISSGPIPATMTAAAQDRYGDDLRQVLHITRVPVPAPGPGEVLVRVEAAGVSRGVWHLAVGHPYVVRLGIGVRRPRRPVPGMDLAGTVAAVGEGVGEFAPGDPVFGTGASTFATYALAEASALVRRPDRLDPAEAAALPDSGSTARQAICTHARVARGERVMVIGASGGVGSYAVQLAVAAGAEVTGVASAAKLDFVRSLGASDVIDYRREEIDARGARYDVIIDIGGNRPLRLLRRALAPRGRLVIVGGERGGPLFGGIGRPFRAQLLALFLRQQMGGMFALPTRDDLVALAAAATSGELRPVVTRTYPLAEAGHALTGLARGEITGKAVVLP